MLYIPGTPNHQIEEDEADEREWYTTMNYSAIYHIKNSELKNSK